MVVPLDLQRGRRRGLGVADAEADSLVQVIEGFVAQAGTDIGDGDVLHAEACQLALDALLALLDGVVLALLAEPASELGAAAGGLEVAEGRVHPVAARRGLLVGEDLDAIAGLELVVERDDLVVDARASAAMADHGFNA